MSGAPSIREAFAEEIRTLLRSEGGREILRDVVSEILAEHPPTGEWITPREFAAEHRLHPATVQAMARQGRLDAVRVGKRQWRIRRGSPIQPLRAEERKASGRELAIERARQLAARVTGGLR